MNTHDWTNVTLEFSAGSRSIKAAEELSLAEILLANRFPPSLFVLGLLREYFPEWRRIR